jgi:hypothetical protein
MGIYGNFRHLFFHFFIISGLTSYYQFANIHIEQVFGAGKWQSFYCPKIFAFASPGRFKKDGKPVPQAVLYRKGDE